MAPIIAFSASRGVRLRSTEMTCAMRAASHGITMGPSLGNPNSSSDIWRSSRKMKVLRYAKGTTKQEELIQDSACSPFLGFSQVILRLPPTEIFCHLLANRRSLLALIMMSRGERFVGRRGKSGHGAEPPRPRATGHASGVRVPKLSRAPSATCLPLSSDELHQRVLVSSSVLPRNKDLLVN
ncbi:unnamed protein product [Spirodela intermedia]|uniref:Uncharacterized protein n=1 Tax=Spirodela intermedia TaxID=51605 RepID=A0A7I8KS17_SPIIN|nr:unnamed protein product [Spirodela intermedia]